MMKNNFLLLLFIAVSTGNLLAQELDFQITINTPKLQTADPRVFQSLQTAVQEFMNNTKWTQDVYEPQERIKGNMIITINKEESATRFTAEVAIQAVRPIYGTMNETPLITIQDKNVWFDYEQFQPLIYTQNSFNDNLTSVLAYYAYIVIGMDNDSFSPFGGEAQLLKAQEIVNNVPPGAAAVDPKGWRSLDGQRNRYWLIENLLSPRVRPLRQAFYDYHRQGLDIMSSDPKAATAIIITAIEDIGDVARSYPNAMILQTFSDTKSTEITDIFGAATPSEKNRVVQVMTRVDGARSARYRSM